MTSSLELACADTGPSDPGGRLPTASYTDEGGGFALVADVLDPQGKHALAARRTADLLSERLRGRPRDATAQEHVRRCFEEANALAHDPDGQRSGSIFAQSGAISVALLATVESGMVIATIGSCRCYRVRAGHLSCLGRGHSAAGALREGADGAGVGEPPDTFALQHHHMVTEALGLRESVRPELRLVPVTPGDRFALCTTNVWGAVSEDELRSALSAPGDARAACRTLASLSALADQPCSIVVAGAR